MADSNSLQMTASNSLQMTASNSAQMAATNPTDETTVLVLVEGNYRVYRRRYYILFLFWMYCLCVGISMNAFNPIARSIKIDFCMGSGEIAFLNIWPSALVLLFFLPTGILMQKFGLRVCMVTFSAITTVGVGVRCLFRMIDNKVEVLFNLSQSLGGFSQAFSQLAPPVISAVWFPPRQRNMATALGSTAVTLGNGLVALIEPTIVGELNYTVVNNTIVGELNYTVNCTEISSNIEIEVNRIELLYFVFIPQLVFTVILLIAILVYFPGKPPTPPSPTQAENMGPIIPALKMLARNKYYWLLSIGVYLMFGIYLTWFSMLNLILKEKTSQTVVGNMAFLHNIGAIIGSWFFGSLTDCLKRRHKIVMVLCFSIGALSMIFYYIITFDYKTKPERALLYVALVFMGVFVVGTLPLVTEVLAEISHPVSENIILTFPMILQNSSNSITSLISSLLHTPNGTLGNVEWLNTCWLVGAICIPISVLFTKVQYKRSDYDNYTL